MLAYYEHLLSAELISHCGQQTVMPFLPEKTLNTETGRRHKTTNKQDKQQQTVFTNEKHELTQNRYTNIWSFFY